MKFLNKLKSLTQKFSKKSLVAVAAVGAVAGLSFAAVQAEFYPNRTPFDYNKACNPTDADIYDRCGSLTGPVFNSFINTPSYGDERAFLDARRSDQTAAGSYKNVLPEVTGGTQEVVVRMYVHNNANQGTNASGLGIAKNTKVRIALPTGSSNALRARGYISADNAAPQLVEDTVDFTAAEEFTVAYVPGSAILYDNNNFSGGVKLSDSIVTTGAPIGSDALDGNMKGCFEDEAVVQIRIKVTPKKNPNVDLKKQVAIPGTTWGEKVTVRPNDSFKWLITFQNKGEVDLTKVNLNDKLPPHLSVVPGSVRWIYTGTDGQTKDVQQSDTQFFTTGGIGFGTWKPNGGFFVRFETKALGDFEGCEVTLRNIVYNTTEQTGKIEDSADVVIKKDNCQPTTPKYVCEALKLKVLDLNKRHIQLTTQVSFQNAKVKYYTYEFGDGKKIDMTDKATVEHTYEKDGTYVARVKVAFEVNGEVKIVESDKCVASVTFAPDKCPYNPNLPKDSPDCKVVTPPTELPNTGAGSVIGLFVAVSAAGVAAYQVVLRRSNV